MHKVLVVGAGGMTVRELEEVSYEAIRDVVGTDAPRGYLEAVTARFHDSGIIIYCNEEGREYNLPCYAVLKTTGEELVGHILICGDDSGGGEVGLTDVQMIIVKRQLDLMPEGRTAKDAPQMTFIPFETADALFSETKRRREELHRMTRLGGGQDVQT